MTKRGDPIIHMPKGLKVHSNSGYRLCVHGYRLGRRSGSRGKCSPWNANNAERFREHFRNVHRLEMGGARRKAFYLSEITDFQGLGGVPAGFPAVPGGKAERHRGQAVEERVPLEAVRESLRPARERVVQQTSAVCSKVHDSGSVPRLAT